MLRKALRSSALETSSAHPVYYSLLVCNNIRIAAFRTSRRSLGSYYDVLQVSKAASSEEIKAAYQKRVKENHPDLNNKSDTITFLRIREAFETLSKPPMKKDYDLVMGFAQRTKRKRKPTSSYGTQFQSSPGGDRAGFQNETSANMTNDWQVGGYPSRTSYKEKYRRNIPRNDKERRHRMSNREQPVQGVGILLAFLIPALGASTYVTVALF